MFPWFCRTWYSLILVAAVHRCVSGHPRWDFDSGGPLWSAANQKAEERAPGKDLVIPSLDGSLLKFSSDTFFTVYDRIR